VVLVESLTLILSTLRPVAIPRERRARERTRGCARANAEGISAHFSRLALSAGERIEVRGKPALFLGQEFPSADPVLQSWMQDGIDKAPGSRLIQRRNLNE
jgi:hypothetical protein